jgi:hypothetical protein
MLIHPVKANQRWQTSGRPAEVHNATQTAP